MNIRENARRWLAPPEPLAAEPNASLPDALPPLMEGLDPDYLALVREAWEQWRASINFFQFATEPELIDYAIFQQEASRRRYIYMLHQAEHIGSEVSVS